MTQKQGQGKCIWLKFKIWFFLLNRNTKKFCQKSLKKKVAKCWENGLSPARNTFTGVPFQHLVVMEGSFMPNLKAS